MFFRPATHEPVFRKFGDLVSRNNGGSDDFNVWLTALYRPGSRQSSFECLLRKFQKFNSFFSFCFLRAVCGGG